MIKNKEKKNGDMTINEVFDMVEKFQLKSRTDKFAKKIIDTAKEKWEQNAQYAY